MIFFYRITTEEITPRKNELKSDVLLKRYIFYAEFYAIYKNIKKHIFFSIAVGSLTVYKRGDAFGTTIFTNLSHSTNSSPRYYEDFLNRIFSGKPDGILYLINWDDVEHIKEDKSFRLLIKGLQSGNYTSAFSDEYNRSLKEHQKIKEYDDYDTDVIQLDDKIRFRNYYL